MSLDPATTVGTVRLRVGDIDTTRSFYERSIGLTTLPGSDAQTARLGVGDQTLVELVSAPDAPPRPPGTTGLFHLAILTPSRPELAQALKRVVESGWRFTGASDHLVSEALYLNDPEGNGIELYRDRSRDEWPRRNGAIEMDTIPLDLDGVLSELPEGEDAGMPPETRMGHVHLNVAELRATEDFYARALGFDVTVRGYPGALFVSAGGYHHHLGLNTWSTAGGPPPPEDARGLDRYEVVVPDADELERVGERVAAAGYEPSSRDGGLALRDPSGNAVVVRPSG